MNIEIRLEIRKLESSSLEKIIHNSYSDNVICEQSHFQLILIPTDISIFYINQWIP